MADQSYNDADRAADDAARERQMSKTQIEQRAHKRIAGSLMDVLPKRDQEVLAWICDSTGKSPGQIATEMLRMALVKERRNYREAHGGGGATSQNSELLAERLVPRK